MIPVGFCSAKASGTRCFGAQAVHQKRSTLCSNRQRHAGGRGGICIVWYTLCPAELELYLTWSVVRAELSVLCSWTRMVKMWLDVDRELFSISAVAPRGHNRQKSDHFEITMWESVYTEEYAFSLCNFFVKILKYRFSNSDSWGVEFLVTEHYALKVYTDLREIWTSSREIFSKGVLIFRNLLRKLLNWKWLLANHL